MTANTPSALPQLLPMPPSWPDEGATARLGDGSGTPALHDRIDVLLRVPVRLASASLTAMIAPMAERSSGGRRGGDPLVAEGIASSQAARVTKAIASGMHPIRAKDVSARVVESRVSW